MIFDTDYRANGDGTSRARSNLDIRWLGNEDIRGGKNLLTLVILAESDLN
jgi:hypothetical protein